MSLLPGTELDRYTIEALLGEGAMGKVYRAFDTRLERPVAIKVLEPVVPDGLPGEVWATDGVGEAVASALREARAAAAILHPNATAIFDADRIGDTSFIVMELVPGTSLRRLVGDASVPMATRVRWLVDVAGALGAAHRAGVVHRDVKPENIIVRDDGLVKVLDFGIARVPRRRVTDPEGGSSPTPRGADAPEGASPLPAPDHDGGRPPMPPASGDLNTLTSGGGILGTPAYMAPEQIRGEDLDGRADQFGWGVLSYELLTGGLPWAGADPITLLAAVLADVPAPIPPEAGIQPEVAAAVLRALSKSPAARFASMADAAAAMAPYAGARRLARHAVSRAADGPTSESVPSSSVPSGVTAIELGLTDQVESAAGLASLASPPFTVGGAFSERIAPRATSVLPAASGAEEGARSQPPGPASSPPLAMRTLESGPGSELPGTLRLRPPDFSAPVDVDGHLSRLPRDATCKGIFFIELLRLGATAMSPSELFHLAGVPERRYVGFRDYPAAEYARLSVTVALAVHPTLPLGEALRRIGHTAFDTASASLVGKTLFGVYGGDLEPLLFTAPRAYRLFLNFGEVSVEKTAPGVFRFDARDLPAFLETYQMGVVEGVLRHCGARGRLRLTLHALDRATVELEIG